MAKTPIKEFKAKGISVSVFQNTHEKDGKKFKIFSTSIKKQYKDTQTNEWKSTDNYKYDELLILSALSSKAWDFIREKKYEAYKSVKSN